MAPPFLRCVWEGEREEPALPPHLIARDPPPVARGIRCLSRLSLLGLLSPSSDRQWKTWVLGPGPPGKRELSRPLSSPGTMGNERRERQTPPREAACPLTSCISQSRGGQAGGTWAPAGAGGPGGGARPRGEVGAVPQPGPTFMSLIMVWKRPPSALHSFSITASIFPAPAGRAHARSPREESHPWGKPPLTTRSLLQRGREARGHWFCPRIRTKMSQTAQERDSPTCSARLLALKTPGEN